MKAIISPRGSSSRRRRRRQGDVLRVGGTSRTTTTKSPTHGSGSVEDEEVLCMGDMERCYAVLRRLVPSLTPRRRHGEEDPGADDDDGGGGTGTAVTHMDILQHVIDYILDLQCALEEEEEEDTTSDSSRHTTHTQQSTAELLKGTEAEEGVTRLR